MLRGAIWERLGLQHMGESFHSSFGNLYSLTKRYRPIMIYHIKNCELAESLQHDWKFNLHRNILIEWLYFLSFLWRENTDKNPRSNKFNLHVIPGSGIEPKPRQREASPLTTTPSLLLRSGNVNIIVLCSRQLSIWGEKTNFKWSL